MKYKREIIVLSAIIIFFTYIGGPLLKEKLPTINSVPQVIRFHVRANSDSQEDQALKLEIRDEILKEIRPAFEDSTSIDESREIILGKTEDIKTVSRKVVEKWDKDYDVRVSLKNENFPIRKYGNLVFPQGEYEALIVEIGEGIGVNWWCVMFPPICLVDVTHSGAIEEDPDSLDEFIVDETQPFKLKSKIFDFIKSFFEDDEEKIEKDEKDEAEEL